MPKQQHDEDVEEEFDLEAETDMLEADETGEEPVPMKKQASKGRPPLRSGEDGLRPSQVAKHAGRPNQPPNPAKPVEAPIKEGKGRYSLFVQEQIDGIYDSASERILSYNQAMVLILNKLDELLIRFGE